MTMDRLQDDLDMSVPRGQGILIQRLTMGSGLKRLVQSGPPPSCLASLARVLFP